MRCLFDTKCPYVNAHIVPTNPTFLPRNSLLTEQTKWIITPLLYLYLQKTSRVWLSCSCWLPLTALYIAITRLFHSPKKQWTEHLGAVFWSLALSPTWVEIQPTYQMPCFQIKFSAHLLIFYWGPQNSIRELAGRPCMAWITAWTWAFFCFASKNSVMNIYVYIHT